jgi:hypothetical protein
MLSFFCVLCSFTRMIFCRLLAPTLFVAFSGAWLLFKIDIGNIIHYT